MCDEQRCCLNESWAVLDRRRSRQEDRVSNERRLRFETLAGELARLGASAETTPAELVSPTSGRQDAGRARHFRPQRTIYHAHDWLGVVGRGQGRQGSFWKSQPGVLHLHRPVLQLSDLVVCSMGRTA